MSALRRKPVWETHDDSDLPSLWTEERKSRYAFWVTIAVLALVAAGWLAFVTSRSSNKTLRVEMERELQSQGR
jgi:hypothetical protein